MRPVYKMLILFAVAAILWFGVPRILANTRPNMDVVIINKSGQPIAFAQLQTQTTRKDIRIHGIDVGTEVTVKFHNDSEDKFSLFIRFAEGREIQKDGVYLEPGFRMLATVHESEIATERDLSLPSAR